MADITIDDLLHWERGLSFQPPAGLDRDEGVARNVSWAAAIRVTPPIVPALRGDEIVIAPPRTLERIEQSEGVDRAGFLTMLAGQPIAALMVDRAFADDLPHEPAVPLLVTSGAFPTDAESVLNRLFTERRADLYGIGSALSRALSSATMAGAGLDALLDAASVAARRALVLFNVDGTIIARSSAAPDGLNLAGEATARLLRERDRGPQRIAEGGRSWLAMALGSGSRASGTRDLILAIELEPLASTEIERLAIGQTGNAIELLLGQAGPNGLSARDRWNREALVADLLLGRLTSREAADARGRLLGIDPAQPARLALFVTRHPAALSRLRSLLADERGRVAATISDSEFAVLLTGPAAAGTEFHDLMTARRTLSAQDPETLLVISEPLVAAYRAPAAIEQARLLVRLRRNGVLNDSVIRADAYDAVGAFGLLLPFATDSDLDVAGVRQRMDAFATSMLGPLEQHDHRRGSELIATLDAYLQLGGALAQAAERLNIHRNTLSYRLGRIGDLTGRDLNDPAVRFLMQAALVIRAFERAAQP
jgi:purine catabolism regulator